MSRVRDRWQSVKDRSPDQAYSLDKWHGLISNLRHMLKGWGNILRGDFRRKKRGSVSQNQSPGYTINV